jgi:tetratricopeptide (TPR) repeat protein
MGPLYPHLLAASYFLFGVGSHATQLLQWALTLVNVLLVLRIARRLVGVNVALLAAGLYAFYGLPVMYAALLLMETVQTTLLLLAALACLRLLEAPSGRRAVVLGLAIGASALARGNVLILLVAIPLFLPLAPAVTTAAAPTAAAPTDAATWRSRARALVAGRAGRLTAAIWLGAALVILPITLRNWIVGRDFVLLTSNGGVNFYIGQNAEYRGLFGPITISDPDPVFDPAGQMTLESELGRQLRPSEVSRIYGRRALREIAAHPGPIAVHWLRKGYRLLSGYELPQLASWDFQRQRTPILKLLFVPFTLLIACGLPGMLLLRGRGRLVAVIVLAYLASLVPFFPTDRYRLPIAPLVCVAAAAFLGEVVRLLRAGRDDIARRRRLWRQAGRLAGVAILLALVLLPAWSELPPREVNWQAWIYEAFGNGDLGRRGPALAAIGAAEQVLPGYSMTYAMLGQVCRRLGDTEGELAAYRHAEEVGPNFRMHPYLAGRVLRKLGREREALVEFARSARIDSTWARPRFELAMTEKALGDTAAALRDLERAVVLNPGAPVYWNNLASLCAETGRPVRARAALGELTTRFPTYAKGWLNLAVFELGQGRREAAFTALARARAIPGLARADRDAAARIEALAPGPAGATAGAGRR